MTTKALGYSTPKTWVACEVGGPAALISANLQLGAPWSRHPVRSAICDPRTVIARDPRSEYLDGGGGLGPTPSASAPPGNGPGAIVRCRGCIFGSMLPFCLVLCLALWYWLFCEDITIYSHVLFSRTGEESDPWTLLGSEQFVWHNVWLLRHRGRLPWWGGLRTPRYHGPLGWLSKRRQGGPWAPPPCSVNTPGK